MIVTTLQAQALADLHDVYRRNAALKGGLSPITTYALAMCAQLLCPVAAVEAVIDAASAGYPFPFPGCLPHCS